MITIEELREKLNEFPNDMIVVVDTFSGMFTVDPEDLITKKIGQIESMETDLDEGTEVLAFRM